MRNVWDKYIRLALEEDITHEDITTKAVMKEHVLCTVKLIAKEDGVIAGLEVFERVFWHLGEVQFVCDVKDGDEVKAGQVLGILTGTVDVLLTGERTALNYLQRMSGIASMTRRYAKVLEGTKTKLLDTRKTTPGMRVFEKYAVKVGGGCNHRYNLSDGILLKDNHIDAAGGIKEAVAAARAYTSFVNKIEVEVENLQMVAEAIDAGADIIMLDNMSNECMAEAVKLIDGRAIVECSGNVNETRLKAIAQTGVDYISCGALTHSAPILDLSLKALTVLQ